MERLYSAEQAREVDRLTSEECHIQSILLMERAALHISERVANVYDNSIRDNAFVKNKKVLAVAGSGNNGGDVVAATRQLSEKNIVCDIYVISKNVKPSLKEQIDMVSAIGLNIFYECPDMSQYGIIIDGVFGTGLDRDVSGKYKTVIEEINKAGSYIIAADIPSGISADSGKVLGCAVKADETLVFGRNKLGLTLYPALDYVGDVHVCKIGFPAFIEKKVADTYFLLEENDVNILKDRDDNSNKGTFGNILVVAGSENMGGAGILSASSALHSGAGKVTVCTHVRNRTAVLSHIPEVILELYDSDETEAICNWIRENVNGFSSVIVGPGLGMGEESGAIVKAVLESSEISTIIDADALNICAEELCRNENVFLSKRRKYNTIITPHIKEFSRLTGLSVSEIKSDIVNVAKIWAKRLNVILVLKDSKTIITDGYRVIINNYGCNGMATAGSGDVLSGIIANAVLSTPEYSYTYTDEEKKCANQAQLENVARGVLLHALAGEAARDVNGNNSMSATDIVKGIGIVLK